MFFFLSETHLTKARAETIQRKLLFDHMIMSESDGRSGGLLLLWRNDLNVTSSTEHTNYLDICIDEDSNAGWRITGIYGEPSSERKHLTWDYIRDLHGRKDLPWMMLGDFNEILSNTEKEGGNLRPQRCMQGFRDALYNSELDDMGFQGDIFTWRRGGFEKDGIEPFPIRGGVTCSLWQVLSMKISLNLTIGRLW
jgi:hypothetical protein